MAERHTSTEQVELVTEPDELARREAENGLKQTAYALELVRDHVKDRERPFRLQQSLLLQLNAEALRDIHRFAGTYRNVPAKIHGSSHEPPPFIRVADEAADLCEYVNSHWADKSAIHLAAYALWRVNWIHPFADGNGRTARAVSYIVLSVKLDSLLPGTKTIPDQIAEDKTPYYDALEKADAAWKADQTIDVSALEAMISAMLARQLLQAAQEAETVQTA